MLRDVSVLALATIDIEVILACTCLFNHLVDLCHLLEWLVLQDVAASSEHRIGGAIACNSDCA